jgi:hypothetical protein
MRLHTEDGETLTWDDIDRRWIGSPTLVAVIEAWPREPIPQAASVHRSIEPDDSAQYALVHALAALTHHLGVMITATEAPDMPAEGLPPGAVA